MSSANSIGNFGAVQLLWIIQQSFDSQNFVPHKYPWRVILVIPYMVPGLNLKWLKTWFWD